MAVKFRVEKHEIAPVFRPAFNIGCLRDVPTSTPAIGPRGETILMGGKSYIESVTGPGNIGKTELIIFPVFTCLDRYPSHRAIVYDTENTLKYSRFNRITQSMKNIKDYNFGDHAYDEDPLLIFIQRADVGGEDFFERCKELSEEKRKNRKAYTYTMPVRGSDGEFIKTIAPHHVVTDSLSAFTVAAVQDKIIDKAEIGEKELNMLFAKDGLAKTQLITQLPEVTVKGGLYFSMTAHIGTKMEMDPYAPKPAALMFSKKGHKAKGAPEKFMYINDFLLEGMGSSPLTEKGIPVYPLTNSDREKSNDLYAVASMNSRNKNGPSGVEFPYIISQSESIKVGLTEYAYLKENGKFGIGGNNTTFHLDIYPKRKLMRTTIRKFCDTDDKLKRALEITSEMLQMVKVWRVTDFDLHISPAELYQKISDLGYDWDTLLNTRGYWMFKEDEPNQLPFLSTLDLLKMAREEYHPYWLESDKKTVIPNHWTIGWE